MAIPGWTQSQSPFHEGELAIQAKLGVQERIDQQARRMIRTTLIPQHREFFAQLAYITVGTLDSKGRPWASLLVGDPGFLSTPDERTLRVSISPLAGDPLVNNLAEGKDIGFLGIELNTRRRNRLNGKVKAIGEDGFEVQVQQSFGNCPQYIQARSVVDSASTDSHPKNQTDSSTNSNGSEPNLVQTIEIFSEADRALISTADTFFIATAYQDSKAGLASGVDVSHRGGKPGFVRVEENVLTVPDFSGNHHFNTFGNIALNPRAGLLFISFETGDLLYLTGTAEVIWEGPEVSAYEGAERLLRFRLDVGYRVADSLALRWSLPEFSPYLERTGVW